MHWANMYIVQIAVVEDVRFRMTFMQFHYEFLTFACIYPIKIDYLSSI